MSNATFLLLLLTVHASTIELVKTGHFLNLFSSVSPAPRDSTPPSGSAPTRSSPRCLFSPGFSRLPDVGRRRARPGAGAAPWPWGRDEQSVASPQAQQVHERRWHRGAYFCCCGSVTRCVAGRQGADATVYGRTDANVGGVSPCGSETVLRLRVPKCVDPVSLRETNTCIWLKPHNRPYTTRSPYNY